VVDDNASDDDVEADRGESSRTQVILQAGQRYEVILREVNKPPDGTGLSRLFNWTEALPGGNAQNAALAAGARAQKVSTFLLCMQSASELTSMYQVIARRVEVFGQREAPCYAELADARVGTAPGYERLSRGSLLFVCVDTQLLLARGGFRILWHQACSGTYLIFLFFAVITMYNPSGGKAICHGWVGSATNIAALSYLLVQTFEHRWGRSFDGIHGNCRPLGTLSYIHIFSDAALRATSSSQCTFGAGFRTFKIDAPLMSIFNELSAGLPKIDQARIQLKSRRRKAFSEDP
jgi:hypothetical protein